MESQGLREWEDAALALLKALLRLDTTNPGGPERPAAELCAEALRADGLEPELLEGQPGRTNLVCRLKGTGEKPPLLLTAHLDVVPAGEDWTHPPFAGEEHAGCLWGRGAMDMKHHVAMCVTVLRALAREGRRLTGDVVLALVADEEAGGGWGSEWLVDHHPEKVRAEYALGEMGGFTLHLGGRRFYPIQVAQKGTAAVTVRARGPAGHGSVPREDSAVVALAEAVARLGRTRLPVHVTPATRAFLRTVARELGFPRGLALEGLLHPRLAPRLLRALPDASLARTLHAMLANTAAPTGLRAGGSRNVLPSRAEAQLDVRTLPGEAGAGFLEELRAVVGPGLEVEVTHTSPAVEASPATPLFAALAEAVRRADPEGVPVPFLLPGATDARAFARNGTTWYGFTPVCLPPGLPSAALFHGRDERIPVDGFRWGLRVLLDAVGRFRG